MAFAESFTSIMETLKITFFYSWWLILLVGVWVNRYRWAKFPLDVVIIEKRGDNLIKTNDRAGKFHDKFADMTFYKLKKSGDTIPVYDFNWILHNVAVPTNLLEKYVNMMQGSIGTIFLFRYGSKQYKPLKINDALNQKKKFVPVKDDKGNNVYTQQYVQFDPRNMMGLIDFEVIDWDNMNFMVQEQRASITRRMKKGEFWKQTLMPMIIIAGAVIASIMILKFSADAGTDLRGYQFAATQNEVTPENVLGDSAVAGAIGGIVTPGQ